MFFVGASIQPLQSKQKQIVIHIGLQRTKAVSNERGSRKRSIKQASERNKDNIIIIHHRRDNDQQRSIK